MFASILSAFRLGMPLKMELFTFISTPYKTFQKEQK